MKIGPFRRSLMRLFGVAATKAPPEKPPFDPNQQLNELIESIIADAKAKHADKIEAHAKSTKSKSAKVQAALDASLERLKAEGHDINGVSVKKVMADGSMIDVTAEYYQGPEPEAAEPPMEIPTKIDGSAIDKKDALFTWASWRSVQDLVQRAGWAACRFPIRVSKEGGTMVTGIVRGSFGIYLANFRVCDDDEDEQIRADLACISHLRSGAAIGIFATADEAAAACDIAEATNVPWREIDPDLQNPAWFDALDRTIAAWQFNGIRKSDKRHAHADGDHNPLVIFEQPASAILDGKPEVLS